MGGDEKTGQAEQDELEKVTAEGTLLLFRYFDPTPEPGQAYRYRVRLTVRNPNFGRGPDEVDDPAIAQGETRNTPWSAPTEPVIVPPDTRYFLTRTGQARDGSEVARLEMIQWSREHGTPVKEILDFEPGQLLVEKKATLVIDPAAQTYEEKEDYTFDTRDALVDLNSYGDDVAAANPILNLGARGTDFGRALVLKGTGEVQAIDASLLNAQASAVAEVKRFQEALSSLKVVEPPPGSEYGEEFGYEEYGYGDEGEGGYGGRGSSRRR